MNILACMVVETSLTKHFIPQTIEGKKIGQIQRRISSRRLVFHPIIQQVIIKMNTKYEYYSLDDWRNLTKNFILQSMVGKKTE